MEDDGADTAGTDSTDSQDSTPSEETLAAMLPALEVLSTLGDYPTAIAPAARSEPGPFDLLPPRKLKAVALIVQGYTQREVAERVGVKDNTIRRWRMEEVFSSAIEDAMGDVREATRPLLVHSFRAGVMKLRDLLTSEDVDIQLKAAANLTKLYRPDPVGGAVQGESEQDAEGDWARAYTQRGQAFLPHDTQLQAINCLARYLVLVAGVQSGKTDTGAINFWKRIQEEDDPTAVYWLVAPTTGIGKVMRKRFVKRAPKGWLLDPAGSGQDFERTWKLKNGATVEFHSANKAANLVAETVSGVWLDEFTLMRSAVWHVSIRARVAATGGWAIFTGTPRGQNWGYSDVWRRADPADDLYDPQGDWVGFTWHSSANPLISSKEVEDAKATLPEAFYRREWEASWEAFHGQVFPDFTKAMHVFDLTKVLTTKQQGDLIDVGVDWGYGKPGAMVVGRYNGDDSWDVLKEIHTAKKLEAWWNQRAFELHETFGVNTFWCDSAEPDRIVGLRRYLKKRCQDEGLPIPRVKRGKKARWPGIRHCAKLFKGGMVRVHRDCETVTSQLLGYKFKEDRQGDDMDEIEKGNDHTVDAFRYMVFTRHKAGRAVGEISMGS